MKKFNSSKPKKEEICKKCVKTCKNKDGSTLITCNDYKEKILKEK